MQRPPTTRERILETARALIGDGDPETLNVADVVVGGEVSNGSVYHHFGSRQGLLDALAGEAWGGYRVELQRARGDVADLVARQLEWIEGRPREARLLGRVDLSWGLANAPTDLARAVVFAPAAEIRTRWVASSLRGLPTDYVPALAAAAAAGLRAGGA